LCEKKSDKECKDNLLKYLRVIEIENFNNSETFIKDLLLKKMNNKLSSSKVTSVFIDYELDNE
jgi:hypothetical protein